MTMVALQLAAQFPAGECERLLEHRAFTAANGGYNYEDTQKVVKDLWFAFVWREKFMEKQ